MKETPVQIIEKQLYLLPKKDIEFAKNFIASREFDKLREIVKSDVLKVERCIKRGDKSEDLEDKLSGLESLLGDINEYCDLLGYESDFIDDEYEDIIEEYD